MFAEPDVIRALQAAVSTTKVAEPQEATPSASCRPARAPTPHTTTSGKSHQPDAMPAQHACLLLER